MLQRDSNSFSVLPDQPVVTPYNAMTSLEKLSDSPFCFAHNGAREIERLLAWRQACSALQGLSDSLSHPAAPGRVRRIVDVDQHQARYLFTGRMKLLRHLECD